MSSEWENVFQNTKSTREVAPKTKPSSKSLERKLKKIIQNAYQPLVKHPSGIPPLFQHQKTTLDFSRTSPLVFDASDPGTGKTRAALEAWAERRLAGGGKLLVLCPKSLMQPAWGNDIEKFIPTFSYIVAFANSRALYFDVDADIYITNIDAVKFLAEQKKSFFSDFDSLIIDESTAYKHRTSARSKAAVKIAQHFTYRTLMTGTPNPNSVTELWNQMRILDDGIRLGTQFFAFRNAVQDSEQIGPQANHLRWTDKPGAEVAVANLVSDVTVRHKFEDCIDIPETNIYRVTYTPDAKTLSAYGRMEGTAILDIKSQSAVAVNAAVLRQKLLQIASGSVYGEDGTTLHIDNGRYELVTDLINVREHSICFFNWKHQKEALIRYADQMGYEYAVIDGNVPVSTRNNIVNDFQSGKYKCLYLHPETGAHGLTLTRATCAIWASPIDRADWLKQGIHRIKRAGQMDRTEIICVQAEHTLEERVYDVLFGKTVNMNNLLELLE